jgi:hypothetical protein
VIKTSARGQALKRKKEGIIQIKNKVYVLLGKRSEGNKITSLFGESHETLQNDF